MIRKALTATIAFHLLGAALLHAEITLHADFDGASLNVANSTISGSSVTLAPRATWSTKPNKFRNIYFRADGVAGRTPRFRIYSPPLSYLGMLSNLRFVYSTDGDNWQFFDINFGTGSDYTFYNNSPFVADTVFVSWFIPYTVTRAREFVDDIAFKSPHVSPTNSADPRFVLGHGAGGRDELGRTIPPQELLGVRITDDRIARSEKHVAVLVAGNHSGENYGPLTLEGLIRFATGNHPLAVELRERVEFIVYPIVNPDGRYAGYYRSSPENPASDYNRVWNNVTAFTDLTIVRNAMVADTGGTADMLLDFHNHFNPTKEPFLITSDAARFPLVTELQKLRPRFGHEDYGFDRNNPLDGHLDQWAGHALGLDAWFVGSPESRPGLPEQDYLDLGRDFAIALAKALGSDDSDGDLIPDRWERTYTSDLATLSTDTDTDHDGRSDRDEWLENTDPTTAGSFFQPAATHDSESGELTINWPGHAGRTYQLEGSSTLQPNSWTPLAPPSDGTDGPMEITVSTPESGPAFFRIVTAQKPLPPP